MGSAVCFDGCHQSESHVSAPMCFLANRRFRAARAMVGSSQKDEGQYVYNTGPHRVRARAIGAREWLRLSLQCYSYAEALWLSMQVRPIRSKQA
jgi:hypothetical protein